MSDTRDKGRRLYKARGRDGEVEWVDHDELWRLQQSQAEELRRDHARRRRLLLLSLAGLVALVLVLVVLRLRSGGDPPRRAAVQAPQTPAIAAEPEAEPGPPVAAAEPDAVTTSLVAEEGPEPRPVASVAEARPSPAEQVASAVRAWAGAWARQDVPGYLASYADEFRPAGGRSRQSWESLRRRRLQAPVSIRVQIEQLEITLRGEGLAEASFLQRYSSPRYSDVVRKSLQLVEEDGGWRIAAERAESP